MFVTWMLLIIAIAMYAWLILCVIRQYKGMQLILFITASIALLLCNFDKRAFIVGFILMFDAILFGVMIRAVPLLKKTFKFRWIPWVCVLLTFILMLYFSYICIAKQCLYGLYGM